MNIHYYTPGNVERWLQTGYEWRTGYSRVTETGTEYPWLTRREARQHCQQNGDLAVFHQSEQEARAAMMEQRAAEEPEGAHTAAQGRWSVQQKGRTYWQVDLHERVPQEDYAKLRASCREAGGWNTRQESGVAGGFAFDCPDKAREWAGGAL